jgi:hypothetical protein
MLRHWYYRAFLVIFVVLSLATGRQAQSQPPDPNSVDVVISPTPPADEFDPGGFLVVFRLIFSMRTLGESSLRSIGPSAAIIDSQSGKAAQKGAARSIRRVSMPARRSPAASGTSSSIRWASC